MTMFVGFPVTHLRFMIRVSILSTLAVSLSGSCMLLTYTERRNACSYIINLLSLKLQ